MENRGENNFKKSLKYDGNGLQRNNKRKIKGILRRLVALGLAGATFVAGGETLHKAIETDRENKFNAYVYDMQNKAKNGDEFNKQLAELGIEITGIRDNSSESEQEQRVYEVSEELETMEAEITRKNILQAVGDKKISNVEFNTYTSPKPDVFTIAEVSLLDSNGEVVEKFVRDEGFFGRKQMNKEMSNQVKEAVDTGNILRAINGKRKVSKRITMAERIYNKLVRKYLGTVEIEEHGNKKVLIAETGDLSKKQINNAINLANNGDYER